MSGRCLEGVGKGSGGCLECVRKEGVRKISRRCLEVLWKGSKRCLEAAHLTHAR